MNLQERTECERNLYSSKKKLQMSKNNAAADFTKELPEPLISSIISNIPFDEAVRTSVLSKRWRSLWKGIDRVEFDPTHIKPWKHDDHEDSDGDDDHEDSDVYAHEDLKKSTMNKIDDIMVLSLSDNITVCKITHFSGSGIFKFLRKQNKLEELSLVCEDGGDVIIDPGTFKGNNLSVLELSNYKIEDASIFNSCVNLKTLSLHSIILRGGDTLYQIMNCCPTLENLALRCHAIDSSQEFVVCSGRLKSLMLFCTSKCKSRGKKTIIFEVECPALKKLVIHYFGHENVRRILQRSSGLVQGIRDDNQIKDLLALCITLDLNNNRDVHVLACILDRWVNLQEIEIINKIDRRSTKGVSLYENDLDFWDKRDVPFCIFNKMRVVNITGFTGKGQEITFAFLIISKATKLEKLVIECSDICPKIGAEKTRGLLSVQPKASSIANIVLKPGMKYMTESGDDFVEWMSTLK